VNEILVNMCTLIIIFYSINILRMKIIILLNVNNYTVKNLNKYYGNNKIIN